MFLNKPQFSDRLSVSKNCKNTFCARQIGYTHPLKHKGPRIQIICCESVPPAPSAATLYCWDTHVHQIKEKLRQCNQRDDLRLNIICRSETELEEAQDKTGPHDSRIFMSYDFIPEGLNKKKQITKLPYFFDSRSSDYAHLKASSQVIFNRSTLNCTAEISIIIPTFKHLPHLKKVLKNLQGQEIDFEIVIVGTLKDAPFLKNIALGVPKYNLKIITLDFERELGDNRYAAGHMRNIGAYYSSSPLLLFMDSDILLPKKLLRYIAKNLESHDIVMPKRQHKRNVVSSLFRKTTKRENDKHWLNFYSQQSNWSDLKSPWMFVSTFTLGIKRSFFDDIGGFNPSFNSYGFEDVELGYRAHKMNARFCLLNSYVQHLFHHNERSEYQNSEDKRQEMLARGAQIFFRIHQDQEVYEQLKHYLSKGSF